MWSRIRTVMMWVLFAALPVQSWAVATMVNCGPTHHKMGAADPGAHGHDARSHEAHSHDPTAMSGHDHASQAHDAVADDQVDPDQASQDKPPLSIGKFKCSACATCCLGMALPSSIVTFDASVSSDTVQPGMPQAHVVFLTAGLERPPRNILA